MSRLNYPFVTDDDGTARFFAFSWTVKGTTEKVLQFIIPFESIYSKNLSLIEQKMFFEHYREVQTIKNL